MKRLIFIILLSFSLIFAISQANAREGRDGPTARFWTAMSAAPTVTDDVSKGYRDRDFWESGNSLWVCTDNTAGAANWFQVVGTASGNSVYLLNLNLPLANFTPSGNTLTGTWISGLTVATIHTPFDTAQTIFTPGYNFTKTISMKNIGGFGAGWHERTTDAYGEVGGFSFNATSLGAGNNDVDFYLLLAENCVNTARFFVKSSGEVGIGTITPNANTKVDVQGRLSSTNGVSTWGNSSSGVSTGPVTGVSHYMLVGDNQTGLAIQIDAAQATVTTADTYLDFRSNSGSEGSVAGTAVAGVIAFNTFTGSHYTKVIGDRSKLISGTLLEVVDEGVTKDDLKQKISKKIIKHPERLNAKSGVTEPARDEEVVETSSASEKPQLFKTRICATKGSKRAIGVYGGTDDYGRDLVLCMGTGFVWLANKGQDLEIGDLLMSSDVTGQCEAQGDDIIRNKTLAKLTQDVKWQEGEKVRWVKVIYLGG